MTPSIKTRWCEQALGISKLATEAFDAIEACDDRNGALPSAEAATAVVALFDAATAFQRDVGGCASLWRAAFARARMEATGR